MADRMSVQDALELARKFASPTVKDHPESIKATPEPAKAIPEPVKATPEPVKATPEPVKATPEPVKAPPEPVKAPPESVSAKSKPAEKKSHGALSEFAAKLLAAQTALDKSQAKYDAAKADLDGKRADLLKATEDIQNSVMKSTGSPVRETRRYITSDNPVSLPRRIAEVFESNPGKIFSAHDIAAAICEENMDSPKIFSALMNLLSSGKVIRSSRGRYQLNDKPF